MPVSVGTGADRSRFGPAVIASDGTYNGYCKPAAMPLASGSSAVLYVRCFYKNGNAAAVNHFVQSLHWKN